MFLKSTQFCLFVCYKNYILSYYEQTCDPYMIPETFCSCCTWGRPHVHYVQRPYQLIPLYFICNLFERVIFNSVKSPKMQLWEVGGRFWNIFICKRKVVRCLIQKLSIPKLSLLVLPGLYLFWYYTFLVIIIHMSRVPQLLKYWDSYHHIPEHQYPISQELIYYFYMLILILSVVIRCSWGLFYYLQLLTSDLEFC